jgi:DNA-nicking Smr family endonuclease
MDKNDDEDQQAFIEAMRHITRLPQAKKSNAAASPEIKSKFAASIPLLAAVVAKSPLPSTGHSHNFPLPLAGEGGAKRRERANVSSRGNDTSKPNKYRLKPRSALDASTPTVISPQPYQPEVGAEEILSYQDPSINHLSWRRFKTGQLRIDMRLDLHGLTLLEAEQALEAFISQANDNGAQYLLIIHGKGSHDGHTPPALKNWLWRWLRNYPRVLAIHSAPNNKGGAGAALVWLKKRD